MARISFYEVHDDPDRFQFLLFDEAADWCFDGRPYRDEWRPPQVLSYMPKLREGDFWNFGLGGNGKAWAIRPEAFECAPGLEQLLAYSGEFLPLPWRERNFCLFNITECIDALDKDRTTWDFHGTERSLT